MTCRCKMKYSTENTFGSLFYYLNIYARLEELKLN